MKNARYMGDSGTGVELMVLLADGQQYKRHIQHGEALPEDINGVRVDAELIERLLETDQWKGVDETPAQRTERLQAEKQQLEQEEAAAAAAAEHTKAADKATAAAAAAEQKATEHQAAGEKAAAEAVARVRAEQAIRELEQTINAKGGTS